MSALPQKADIRQRIEHVCFVLKADMPPRLRAPKPTVIYDRVWISKWVLEEDLVRRVLFAVVWSIVAIVPALADVRILSSPGGVASDYLKFFSRVGQSGERVVIDGPCLSACTLVLVIPRNRICVTSRAVLGFHAPEVVDYRTGRIFRSGDATRAVAAAYPASDRAWIRQNGGLTQKRIFLRGRQLAALYPRC